MISLMAERGDGLLVSGELDDPNRLAAVTRDAVTRVLD